MATMSPEPRNWDKEVLCRGKLGRPGSGELSPFPASRAGSSEGPGLKAAGNMQRRPLLWGTVDTRCPLVGGHGSQCPFVAEPGTGQGWGQEAEGFIGTSEHVRCPLTAGLLGLEGAWRSSLSQRQVVLQVAGPGAGSSQQVPTFCWPCPGTGRASSDHQAGPRAPSLPWVPGAARGLPPMPAARAAPSLGHEAWRWGWPQPLGHLGLPH